MVLSLTSSICCEHIQPLRSYEEGGVVFVTHVQSLRDCKTSFIKRMKSKNTNRIKSYLFFLMLKKIRNRFYAWQGISHQIILSILVFSAIPLWGQSAPTKPALKFEISKHNFGEIEIGALCEMYVKFENTSKYPVIIENAYVSQDGGTSWSFPREPILPIQKSSCKFQYGTDGRPGHFRRTFVVQWKVLDSVHSYGIHIVEFQGTVVFPKIEVELFPDSLSFDTLSFGEEKSFQIKVINKSTRIIYPELHSNKLDIQIDEYSRTNDLGLKPGDSVFLLGTIKNVFGNIGLFESGISLHVYEYNYMYIPITVTYAGAGYSHYEKNYKEQYVYENGELTKVEHFLNNGKIFETDYYEKGKFIKTGWSKDSR
jgi:hypothetical protein